MSCASAANLLAKYLVTGALRPPRLRIDGPAILLELDVEGRLTVGPGRARATLAHASHGFPREYELADLYANLIHPRQQKIVAIACVDDQETPIGPERPGEFD